MGWNRLVARALACAVVVGIGINTVQAAVRPDPQDTKSATSDKATAPLNLNAATAADLQKLPGIGPAMANRIVEYRQKNGGFKKIEELMNVTGIGERNFLKLKPLITIAPAKTAER